MKPRAVAVTVLVVTSVAVWATSVGRAPQVTDAWPRLFEYDASTPLGLDEREVRTFDGGIMLLEATFASPRGGRVHAYRVAPGGKGPFPVVVFGPWGLGNRTEFVPEALIYARLGAASVIVDWPWTRPPPDRRDQGPLDQPWTDHAVFAQAVVDLRRAIDVMAARDDVSVARVVYVGHSYGAQFGTILAAVDRRVGAAALMTGVPDNAAFLVESTEPDAVAYRRRWSEQQIAHYLDVNAPFDAVRWIGRITPRPVLLQFAELERGLSMDAMRRHAAAAGDPKTVLWYPTGHELNDPRAVVDRMTWVAGHLGITVTRGRILDLIETAR